MENLCGLLLVIQMFRNIDQVFSFCCYITNSPKTQWLKTTIYNSSPFLGLTWLSQALLLCGVTEVTHADIFSQNWTWLECPVSFSSWPLTIWGSVQNFFITWQLASKREHSERTSPSVLAYVLLTKASHMSKAKIKSGRGLHKPVNTKRCGLLQTVDVMDYQRW